jgi:hypothetical protein
MLLGLNRMLNHDFLPPWGVEFLLRVNTKAWWYYSHYVLVQSTSLEARISKRMPSL